MHQGYEGGLTVNGAHVQRMNEPDTPLTAMPSELSGHLEG